MVYFRRNLFSLNCSFSSPCYLFHSLHIQLILSVLTILLRYMTSTASDACEIAKLRISELLHYTR